MLASNRVAVTWFVALVIAALVGCTASGRRGGLRQTTASDGFPAFRKTRTFNPTRYPNGNWHPAGLAYEDVWFRSLDGTCLHGWYLENENPRAVVLYCHGNSGNLSHRADVLRTLHGELELTVFIFDYRGYGRSHGRPSEEGVLADARAARAWLARRAGLPPQQIVLVGHALGTAVAVDLAARGGARALVLETAFTSVPDIGESYFPWLPVRLLTQTELNSVGKIRRYHGPLLQSHGDADSIVPYQLGSQLHRAANQPKQFLTLRNHDHMDPLGAEYYGRLGEFLDGLDAAPAGPPAVVRQPRQSPPDDHERARAKPVSSPAPRTPGDG